MPHMSGKKVAAILVLTLATLGGLTRSVFAESLGHWEATTNYPIPFVWSSCVTYLGYIYCVGGWNNSPTNAVYYAPISSSGVGAWTSTTSYPISVDGERCVTDSGNIYCIGGYSPSGGVTGPAYYSKLSSSGVGIWNQTTSYPISVVQPGCVVDSGYIFCVAGGSGSVTTNVAYYTRITKSGISTWKPTTSYPVSVGDESCVADASYIYCLGGNSWGTNYNSVYYAQLSSSGIGVWTPTVSYPLSATSVGCFVIADYIYCVGGYPPLTNAVYYAQLSSSGVNSWTRATNYPTVISELPCATYSGYVYCVGGGPGHPISEVYYAGVGLSTASTVVSSTSVTTTSTSTAASTGTPLSSFWSLVSSSGPGLQGYTITVNINPQGVFYVRASTFSLSDLAPSNALALVNNIVGVLSSPTENNPLSVEVQSALEAMIRDEVPFAITPADLIKEQSWVLYGQAILGIGLNSDGSLTLTLTTKPPPQIYEMSKVDILVTLDSGTSVGSLWQNGVFLRDVNEIPGAVYSGHDSSPTVLFLPPNATVRSVQVYGIQSGEYHQVLVGTYRGKESLAYYVGNISQGQSQTFAIPNNLTMNELLPPRATSQVQNFPQPSLLISILVVVAVMAAAAAVVALLAKRKESARALTFEDATQVILYP